VFYLRIIRNELKEFGKIDAIEVEDWDKFVALYFQSQNRCGSLSSV
jgi:hypothetical protein